MARHELLTSWMDALSDGTDAVCRLYAPGGIVLTAAGACTTPSARRAFFSGFLARRPTCSLVEAHEVDSMGSTLLVGTYTFDFPDDGSRCVERFTLAWDGKAKIVHHHSSGENQSVRR